MTNPNAETLLLAERMTSKYLLSIAMALAHQMSLHDGGSDVTVRAVIKRAEEDFSADIDPNQLGVRKLKVNVVAARRAAVDGISTAMTAILKATEVEAVNDPRGRKSN